MKKDINWHLNELKKASKASIKSMKEFAPKIKPYMKGAKGEVIGYIDAHQQLSEIIKEIQMMQRAVKKKAARLKVKLL